MAIIIGGRVLDVNTLQQPVSAPVADTTQYATAASIVESPKEPPKRAVFKTENQKIKDGNTLIVNGKKKTIGRKSQYLLDMMIIDDE